MTTTFVTGVNQSDLAANITSDIAAGLLDLTIYGSDIANIMGSNLDRLIPNLHLLQALSFSGDVTILSAPGTFHQANLGGLISLDLTNVTSISGYTIFNSANMDALPSINLLNLTSLTGHNIFFRVSANALTSLRWPADLPDLPIDTFKSISVSSLPGICLGKVTTFETSTFDGILQGPSDMKALGGKTHNDIIYASDFYGYTCPPLVFNISNSGNILSQYSFEKYNGSDATNLVITAVNEGPLPATIGGISIQSDGTVTVNSSGTETFTIRFSADGGLIGARKITVNGTLPSGILNIVYFGSLLNFSLALPPELTASLSSTSDVHQLFSDICEFAQTQDCHNFLAGLVINDYSDLFCSDAVITKRPEIVVVSCSDNVLNLDDDDGHFTFSITNFMSDTVLIRYDDASCHVSDIMHLSNSNFAFQFNDTNFIWVSPCESDAPNTLTNVFSHPLLAINAQGDIVDIGLIDCSGPCHNPTSDLLYVSELRAMTLKLGQYLGAHYSDYTSKISDRCHVLYLGPITADVVTVDIETSRLIFSNFYIPFSDIDVCS